MANERLSLKLYGYLCALSGSENAVRQRRLFFKTLDSAWNSTPTNNTSLHRRQYHLISSGSKAEGLDIDGSDFDIMVLITNYPVYAESTDCQNVFDNCIIFDTNNSRPGFDLLKVHTDLNIHFLSSHVYTDCGILLSSDKIKTIFFYQVNDLFEKDIPFINHGPCISSLDNSIDIAPTLQCNTWPSFAFGWVSRPRSKWPSLHVIEEITENGVLFVPIGDSDKPDSNPNEWRISFSIAEKLLVHSFNHTQLLCYVLLKFVLKEIIDLNSDTKNLLCSYFMKTVVFWEIETNHYLVWEPPNILECYKECFRRLMYFVRCGYCPNYFMPENNMFGNKIFGRAKQKMEVLLNCLMSEGIVSFLRSQSLKAFPQRCLQSQSLKGFPHFQSSRSIGKKEEKSRAILPLMSIINIIFMNCDKQVPSLLIKIRKSHGWGSALVSEMLILYLAYCCGKTAVRMKYDFRIKNKKFYIQRKTCLSHLLIGISIDNVSGWLQIAAFFYQHKQYDMAIIAADHALSESFKDKLLISKLDRIDKKKDFTKNSQSFVFKYSQTVVHVQ